MKEEFLHYIWKHRAFKPVGLQTTTGEPVEILRTGYHNDDAGPDFLEAQLCIGDVKWTGSVEIHIKSSDWYQHGHQNDPNYENVVLHVVWEDDTDVRHSDGEKIPCLTLRDLVDADLLDRYQELTNQIVDIPCQYSIQSVSTIIRQGMLEKTAIERMKKKADDILSVFNSLNQDWEETCYHLLMAAFGMKVNKSSMLRLAELTPFRLLKKYAHEPETLTALLFGQAGLLLHTDDEYVNKLTQRFDYLQYKHELKTSLNRSQWKFSRMRPANFPTIRIAQVSAFLSNNPTLFHLISELRSPSDIQDSFKFSTHPYWEEHYDFGKRRNSTTNVKLGNQMKDHLVINVFSPLLMALSLHFDQSEYMDRALELLEDTSRESNKITRKLHSIGIKSENAMRSQGALALYYDYCLKKKCLQCNIGGTILRH